MTLRTEAGRIQVLKYILEVTAEHDEKGMFSDESGTVANEEYASGEQLATAMLRSDVIGEDGRLRQVLFRADSTELNLLEHLKKGEVMKMAIDVHALNNIAFFTRLKPAFTAPPPEKKMGCAAIEWMKELMPDKILDKMGIGPGHPCDGSKHKDKVEAWKKRNSLGVRKSSPQESAFLQTL